MSETPPVLDTISEKLTFTSAQYSIKKTKHLSLDENSQDRVTRTFNSAKAQDLKRSSALPRLKQRSSLPVNLSYLIPKAFIHENANFLNKNMDEYNNFQKNYKNLCLICALQWGESEACKLVIELIDEALYLKTQSSTLLEAEQELSLYVGELTYLIDQHPAKVLSLVDKKDIQLSLGRIHNTFTHYLKKTHRKIEDRYLAQAKVELNNPQIAKYASMPLEIARILFPQTGIFSESLIPQIIKEFADDETSLTSFTSNLKNGLILLQRSKELRDHLETISLPEIPHSQGAELIRMTLHLPNQVHLKDYHAKRTALSALLTHLRQGSTVSCFASFIAIELQKLNPIQSVIDFKELLSTGKLSRTIEEKVYDFPYLLKGPLDNALHQFTINQKGALVSLRKEIYLWDTPPVNALCRYLGIGSAEKFILDWINTKQFTKGELQLTKRQFINEIATLLNRDPDHLYLVFNSTNHHPLLAMWENSIAGMAEALEGSLLKSALIQSFLFVSKNAARQKGLPDLDESQFLTKIEKEVNSSAHYLFDPSYSFQDSLTGAFILYDSDSNKEPEKWIKVETLEDFRGYLIRMIERVLPDHEFQSFKTAFLEDNKLIYSLLKKYHPENSDTEEAHHIKILRYTPWVNAIGNDPRMVLKVYTQNATCFRVEQIMPVSAENLLNTLIEHLQLLPKHLKSKYLNSENHSLPMRIQGVHAFSFLISHPTMQPFFKKGLKKQDWITENIKKPGMAISVLPITSKMKKGLLEHALIYLKKKHQVTFEEKMQKITGKYSLSAYRKMLIDTLFSFKISSLQREEIEHRLDLKLIELLPKEICKRWEQTLIHFADTNWHFNIHDIHYGIGVNPATGNIELMSLLDNGKIHQFLNQKSLLNLQTWEIYFENSHTKTYSKTISKLDIRTI